VQAKSRRLGKHPDCQIIGSRFMSASKIRLNEEEVISTGIAELDDVLNGGSPRPFFSGPGRAGCRKDNARSAIFDGRHRRWRACSLCDSVRVGKGAPENRALTGGGSMASQYTNSRLRRTAFAPRTSTRHFIRPMWSFTTQCRAFLDHVDRLQRSRVVIDSLRSGCWRAIRCVTGFTGHTANSVHL
jgi:hypothetical protein